MNTVTVFTLKVVSDFSTDAGSGDNNLRHSIMTNLLQIDFSGGTLPDRCRYAQIIYNIIYHPVSIILITNSPVYKNRLEVVG